ncbi:MAG: haloacid dehalogenase [Deltaproteobacteria bacterium]|nr:haloacid dehalogenase [Deltaproteobacteria bacterium]MBU54176.1 haloacid dehalogenase [Deltaproteobacteria bacterium]|tara:strand:- start:2131 stop:2775 length:645 start_codon:yes stop_codon:yes gene_type:complete
MSAFDAVLFDMDGVLVMSQYAHGWAYSQTFAKLGVTFTMEEYLQRGIGLSRPQVIQMVMGEHLSVDTFTHLMEEKVRFVSTYLEEQAVPTVPGAYELVTQLQDINMPRAVVTSSRTPSLFLRSAGLEMFFQTVIDANMVERSKPDPEAYQLAAKQLSVECPRCLVFEDSPMGVAAAKRAGMTVFALTTTHSAEQLAEADALFPSFEALEPSLFR